MALYFVPGRKSGWTGATEACYADGSPAETSGFRPQMGEVVHALRSQSRIFIIGASSQHPSEPRLPHRVSCDARVPSGTIISTGSGIIGVT